MNNNEFDEKEKKEDEEGGSSTGTSTGTGTGSTGYRYLDPSSQHQRDDLRSPEENRRLLVSHQVIHKDRVNKQKLTRKEREMLKQGKMDLVSAVYDKSRGYGTGVQNRANQYLTHPYAYKFSGIRDMEVSIFPGENIPDTNKNEYQNRLELQNRKENRNELRNQKRNTLNLKPRPF